MHHTPESKPILVVLVKNTLVKCQLTFGLERLLMIENGIWYSMYLRQVCSAKDQTKSCSQCNVLLSPTPPPAFASGLDTRTDKIPLKKEEYMNR